MAAITPTVYLVLPQQTAGLDTAALEIGDATTGKVGTGKVAIGGSVQVDISADVQSIQIRRGRSSTLDRPEAGTCTLTLRNDRANAGDYDPLNAAGAYYPWLQSGWIQVADPGDSLTFFTGPITDLTLSEEPPTLSVGTISAIDPLSYFAETSITLTGGEVFASGITLGTLQLVSNTVLNQLLMTVSTNYGSSWLAGTQWGGGLPDPAEFNALDLISRIEQTELGMFYCDPLGGLQFLKRASIVALSSSFTASDAAADSIRYSHIERGSVSDRVVNIVTTHSDTYAADADDIDSVRINDASIAKYGPKPKTFNVHLCTTKDNATNTGYVADGLLADWGSPKTSIRSITIPVARYSGATQAAILTPDIGSVISVKRTAPGASVQTTAMLIVGIEHQMHPRFHEVTFRLVPQPTTNPLV